MYYVVFDCPGAAAGQVFRVLDDPERVGPRKIRRLKHGQNRAIGNVMGSLYGKRRYYYLVRDTFKDADAVNMRMVGATMICVIQPSAFVEAPLAPKKDHAAAAKFWTPRFLDNLKVYRMI